MKSKEKNHQKKKKATEMNEKWNEVLKRIVIQKGVCLCLCLCENAHLLIIKLKI